jgi:hypothetical protein
MSSTDRQSRLLATEDWKRIYQSFRNADFQSYDFDNLRRTMINYLRQNYPEDFNDYIESSEYLALIDLIAFLGQNLSFRVDLNARENFLETAERRESVLRLARLISYNPRRNLAANGLLKFETLKTTESVRDSTGRNLAGSTVRWNDSSNSNFFEQFVKILNAALPVNNTFGRPISSAFIGDVSTEQYRFNGANVDIPVFGFDRSVEGVGTKFEIVSTSIFNGNIVEEPPVVGNSPSFIYRNNNQGAGSANSGFFMHFRQGRLENGAFTIDNPIPNQIVNIDGVNINNSDVWLYSIDSSGFETAIWSKLESVEGNNIIYNSLFENNRNVYAVTTRIDDRISLVFSDGVFGNLPSGGFRVYYRTSDNRNMVISPGDITNVLIDIPYISRSNTEEILTIGLSLKETVANGRVTESNTEIKTNAPATYYTQNRLITGEDYNIGPLGISTDIIKTKSVNRIASGISRYYDLKDPSGKYSKTQLYADDGVIYQESFTKKQEFTFATQSDIEGAIYNVVEPIIASDELRNFYYNKFNRIVTTDLNTVWESITDQNNLNSGKLTQEGSAVKVGAFTGNALRYIETDSLVKFVPPEGQYFTADGKLTDDPEQENALSYKWVKIINVFEDGTRNTPNTAGPILINDTIPSGSTIQQIIPRLSRVIVQDLRVQMIDRTFAYKDYALRYDQNDRRWKLITEENINTVEDFNLGKTGSTTGENQDSSWLLYFKNDGEKYTITYRNLRYVFESEGEIRFFFDSADKIYDPKTGQVQKDKIKVLSVNKQPDNNSSFNRDFDWSISDSFRDKDGYVDTRKIQIEFFDSDDDGVPDNPELFLDIVQPTVNSQNKFIFQKKYTTADGVEDFKYFANSDGTVVIVQNEDAIGAYSSYDNPNQIFYLIDENVFKQISVADNNIKLNSDYRAFVGRSNLRFYYLHVADSNYRIDPASSNIIDTYVLTRNYDREVRRFLRGGRPSMPLPPSTDQLFRQYGSQLNNIKSISDEIVYHPVKYKILFGQGAREDLQVDFKIVKNREIPTNENELKADVISAVNRFFAIENWNFGDTFYFQELAAFIMNSLTPRLVSVVIVPKNADRAFGSLFEIKSESDEIFISSAQVSDVQVINELTATNLRASGKIITSVSNPVTGIQSTTSGG